MNRSNNREIHGQHMKWNASKASTICSKWRNNKLGNLDQILFLFASKKQNCFLWIKPSRTFKNRLQKLLTDRNGYTSFHSTFKVVLILNYLYENK